MSYYQPTYSKDNWGWQNSPPSTQPQCNCSCDKVIVFVIKNKSELGSGQRHTKEITDKEGHQNAKSTAATNIEREGKEIFVSGQLDENERNFDSIEIVFQGKCHSQCTVTTMRSTRQNCSLFSLTYMWTYCTVLSTAFTSLWTTVLMLELNCPCKAACSLGQWKWLLNMTASPTCLLTLSFSSSYV